MSSPASMLAASVRYIAATVRVDDSIAATITEDETKRLVETVGKVECDQDDATEFLEALCAFNPNPFSIAQRKRLSEVIQRIMAGERHAAVSHSTTGTKQQKMLHGQHYLPEALWGVLQSTDTRRNILKQLAHFLVHIPQCRNPDAQSVRNFVALVHVAAGVSPTPDESYEDVGTFGEVLKQTRDDDPHGRQSMRVFPEDPDVFRRRYQDAYAADQLPVKCKVSNAAIKKLSTKSTIPLRNTNGNLTIACRPSKRSRPSPEPITDIIPAMQAAVLRQVLTAFVANGNQNDHDGPIYNITGKGRGKSSSPRTETTIEDSESIEPVVHGGMENSGYDIGMPGCLQGMKRAASTGNIADLQFQVQDKLAKSATLQAAAAAAAAAASAAEPGSDESSGEEDATPASKKHAAKSSKKPAASPLAKIAKKRPAADTRLQSVNSDIGDSPTPAAIVASGQSIFRYPKVVDLLIKRKSPFNRPKPTKEATLYLGGKIYFSDTKNLLRVVRRIGDRIDQTIPCIWKKTIERNQNWALACAIIECDPRAPRN